MGPCPPLFSTLSGISVNHSPSTPSLVLAFVVAIGLCACARSGVVDAPDSQVLVFGSAESQDFASVEVTEASQAEIGNPAGDPTGFASHGADSTSIN
jgi:hypothetical protein